MAKRVTCRICKRRFAGAAVVYPIVTVRGQSTQYACLRCRRAEGVKVFRDAIKWYA